MAYNPGVEFVKAKGDAVRIFNSAADDNTVILVLDKSSYLKLMGLVEATELNADANVSEASDTFAFDRAFDWVDSFANLVWGDYSISLTGASKELFQKCIVDYAAHLRHEQREEARRESYEVSKHDVTCPECGSLVTVGQKASWENPTGLCECSTLVSTSFNIGTWTEEVL